MVKMHAVYEGGLHCRITHEPSKSQIETDAPKDNMGKGERFSPTDMVAGALATCVLTTMAIVAERDGVKLEGARAEVGKEMTQNPRRIGRLPLRVFLPASLSPEMRKKMEHTAHACPVHKSLHPDVKIEMEFTYS